VQKTSVKGDFSLTFEFVLLSFNLENSNGVKINGFDFVWLFGVIILGKSIFKEVLEILLVIFDIIVNFGIGVSGEYVLGVSWVNQKLVE
jgi:hypothetical protein